MSVPFEYPSLTSLGEAELVKALLADRDFRWRILNVRGLPDNPYVMTEVQLDGLGCKGDIDILAIERESPDAAVAIQVKRIKVSASAFISGRPNKIDALSELYRQANLLVDMGFHQVLAYVLVVVDSRTRNIGSRDYQGLTVELSAKVQRSITGEGLKPEAGLVRFEMVQPMDDKPLGAGTFAGQVIRAPMPRRQSARVTRWVEVRSNEHYA